MTPIKATGLHANAAYERQRTARLLQADRFEALAAASETESMCSDWIKDRLSEPGQVSS